MALSFPTVILLLFLSFHIIIATQPPDKRDKNEVREMEYISLIKALLQQTNMLSTVDGAVLAATTILASLMTRMKPMLIISALFYLVYVAAAILVPGPLSRMGIPILSVTESTMKGRSFSDTNQTGRMFDNVVADTLVRSITISPVMNIVSNVSVNVVADAMARVRVLSRMIVQQLSMFQRNMMWFSRSMSNECVSRFLCRVGQVTEANFPMASSMMRSLANNAPQLDDFAVAVVRGTSSSNCSLIYPDCTIV